MCLAIPARVIELGDDDRNLALVDIMGVRRKVSMELLRDDPPQIGDWTLIHVGFAMNKISATQAEEQLRILASLEEVIAAREEAVGYRLRVDD